jgi:transposase
MRIWFRCRHSVEIDPDKVTSPTCPECGDRVVARVQLNELPRFRGAVTGPLVRKDT